MRRRGPNTGPSLARTMPPADASVILPGLDYICVPQPRAVGWEEGDGSFKLNQDTKTSDARLSVHVSRSSRRADDDEERPAADPAALEELVRQCSDAIASSCAGSVSTMSDATSAIGRSDPNHDPGPD